LEQRDARLRAEEEAKKRSDKIDRELKEGEKERRRKKVVKVLLLGQSESGKSTTLKREFSAVFACPEDQAVLGWIQILRHHIFAAAIFLAQFHGATSVANIISSHS